MRSWTELSSADIRLVIADMDGTLLDGKGQVPPGFWELHQQMERQGVTFVPASGRQYATLREMFPAAGAIIAENGNTVVHDGRHLTATSLSPALVSRVIEAARHPAQASGGFGGDFDLGLVLCGQKGAYIERHDEAFVARTSIFYADLHLVDDLHAVQDDVAKLSIFDFGQAQVSATHIFEPLATNYQVVVSSENWVDIQDPAVNKGTAVRTLQEALGLTAAQTVVFGDYLNDMEMLQEAEYSVAMANAHPDVIASARYQAPSNLDHGVVRVLERLLTE